MREKALNLFNVTVLKYLAKATIRKYRPRIIGVTGSVGKTSTKNAIYTVLKAAGLDVRAAGGNLNNETGMPLAILGDYQRSGGPIFLAGAALRGFWGLLKKQEDYPTILVLEYSADKPGDLDYLIGIARPDIAVVTAVGKTPVHIEFYKGAGEVAAEKSKLVKAVEPSGKVILNADDPDVVGMASGVKAGTKIYGFKGSADVRLKDFNNRTEGRTPVGVSFEIQVSGESVPVEIKGVLGKPQAYAAGAAAAVGITVGLTLGEIGKALPLYKGEKGRARILEGVKETHIIDDTYNASPESTRSALEILKSIKAKRKVAVLGDMLELGEHSSSAHRDVGKEAAKAAHVLITVGSDARLIGESAVENSLPDEDVCHFDKAEEAIPKLKKILEERDLVLVKGSQSIRTEKIVKSIMKNPEEAQSLLVRQYGKWLRG